jgi:excisionase family DNA binding protein
MAKDEEIQKFYRAQEAARMLSISLPVLRQWAEEGKIKCFQTPGGRFRYDVQSFLSLAMPATRARLDRKAKARTARPSEPMLPMMAEADKINERGGDGAAAK